MTLGSDIFLRCRSIVPLAMDAELGGRDRAVHHAHSLAPHRVALPPLETGRLFLERWRVRELPHQEDWRAPDYECFAPPIFVLRDALVHSSAGILGVGPHVVEETLVHTAPVANHYTRMADGITIPGARVRKLPGIHVSLLAGAGDNYFQSMIEGMARLMAVPETYLAVADGLLVPRGAIAQREVLTLLDLMPTLKIREVGAEETLQVETLIFPLSVCGEATYHPCVSEFFRRLSAQVPPFGTRFPRNLYIDRRGTALRPLLNEDAVVAALAGLGFEPVRPETLSVADQIRLFRGAEMIVAPHGAGLTNLGFARPGCKLVELLSDSYVHWCYRNLAALQGLRYDCVLGRAQGNWAEMSVAMHRTPWRISVNHVVAAVAKAMMADSVKS